MAYLHNAKCRMLRLPITGLAFILMIGLLYQVPVAATSSQSTCIGVGGWPCGYTGPFTGDYYEGYATVGCTPLNQNGTCAVPQIAIQTGYLVISKATYVVDWANQTFQSLRPIDGSMVSVSGNLAPIFYNRTAGSTYMIYYSNARGLWNPQPGLQIENATLTTQSATTTCTTTLTFTVSGPPNGTWNLPMMPAGACYTINNVAEQQPATADRTGVPFQGIVLISSGLALILIGTLAVMRKRRK